MPSTGPSTMILTKPIDRSSPLLMRAAREGETLTVNLSLIRLDFQGLFQPYLTYELRNATISSVTTGPDYETVTIVYSRMAVTHTSSGTEYVYQGRAPAFSCDRLINFITRPPITARLGGGDSYPSGTSFDRHGSNGVPPFQLASVDDGGTSFHFSQRAADSASDSRASILAYQ
ncbi:MAG: hypothetical protein HC888_10570 [Candidatus Competibacteraceae bacterium]|nr:hypothetical protein [Candidatus Competibacteraceae bacterium]